MAKYYGKIGYERMVESTPGVWTPVTTVKSYYGDVYKQTRRLDGGQQVNDNINISNQFSIVADPYAYDNFRWIRYVELMGAKWKITNVEVQYPRLLLSVGGLYNGSQT